MMNNARPHTEVEQVCIERSLDGVVRWLIADADHVPQRGGH